MRRLLCIVGVMDVGGAETFLMKVFRSLDRTKYMLDFAVASSKKGFYDDEILKLGGRIFHIPPKSTGLFKNFNRIRQIVKENSYKSVLRISQHSLSALELLAAWLGGARIRAFRSSNSNTVNGSKMELFIHKLCLFMPKLFANVKIAPSTESAVFMFGKRCLKKKKVAIVKNGIDLSFYKYSDHERERIRKELSINDCFVVGHIGRFSSQKNHPYLIKIFKEIKKKNENSLLLLVGDGEQKGAISKLVANNNLSDSVLFVGIRSDIPALLSAMDVFIFPSFYEGMPNTIIEAQACGLPCIVSDTISKESRLSNIVDFLSLKDNEEIWAKKALSFKGKRLYTGDDIVKNGYSIEESTKQLVDLLFINAKTNQ